jgi:O-antigen/teichoic acid export membrane protein
MIERGLRQSVIFGIIWKFFERIGAQAVTFIVSIVLARLLSPSDYGTIALVTVFITIANVFVDNSFGNALIQKKDADNVDFSSVFFFNIGFSLVLFILIYNTAPYVAIFYEMDKLSSVLRVLALSLPFAGINSVQYAYVSRHMIFKKFFFSTLGGTISSAFVGIILAYNGFGVWALVAQYLTNRIINTLLLWYIITWRPEWKFSFRKMKALFNFGSNILISSLLSTTYNELRNLIIGKLYTSADLGYYSKGKQFPQLLVNNINSSISQVIFPAISRHQDDTAMVKIMTRRAIKTSTYIMCPMLIGLAVIARPLIELLLTEKWLPCVPYLQIVCLYFVLMPSQTANLAAIKAVGRSDIFLKLEIIKRTIGLIILLLVMRHGVFAIAASAVITTLIASFVNAYPNRKLIEYKYKEQILDMLPSIGISAIMGVVIYTLGNLFVELNFSNITIIFTQVITGVATYVGISFLFKIDEIRYLINLIKSLKSSSNKQLDISHISRNDV